MPQNHLAGDHPEISVRQANLRGASFRDVNLAGARLNDVNLAGTRITDANMRDVRIEESCIDGLVIWGVEIRPLVEAELARRRAGTAG
jgi:uncharacterized protein YjbI with pentapeptide repeats